MTTTAYELNIDLATMDGSTVAAEGLVSKMMLNKLPEGELKDIAARTDSPIGYILERFDRSYMGISSCDHSHYVICSHNWGGNNPFS